MHATRLLNQYPIISDQIKRPALEIVLGAFEQTLQKDIAGDVVEFGCYIGTTSLFLRRLLNIYQVDASDEPVKVLHVYDSFQGLPPKTAADSSPVGADFKAGELSISRKQLQQQFYRAGLRPPVIHKGWFDKLASHDIPPAVSFAFLDGDFYQSIFDSLKLVYPRMQPGGIIAIDDCNREALPGVDRAVRDFLQNIAPGKPYTIKVAHNIGLLKI